MRVKKRVQPQQQLPSSDAETEAHLQETVIAPLQGFSAAQRGVRKRRSGRGGGRGRLVMPWQRGRAGRSKKLDDLKLDTEFEEFYRCGGAERRTDGESAQGYTPSPPAPVQEPVSREGTLSVEAVGHPRAASTDDSEGEYLTCNEQLSEPASTQEGSADLQAFKVQRQVNPNRGSPGIPATEVLDGSSDSPDGLEVQGPSSAKPATARSSAVSWAEHQLLGEEDEWQADWQSTSESEDNGGEGRRRKRRRQPRKMLLTGEFVIEHRLSSGSMRVVHHSHEPSRQSGQMSRSGSPEKTHAAKGAECGKTMALSGAAANKTQETPSRPPLTMQRLRPRNRIQMGCNSFFCGQCGDGGELLACDGTCLRSFHTQCLAPDERPSPIDNPEASWYCLDCRIGLGSCAMCKRSGVVGKEVIKCKMGNCGWYFHNTCLNDWRGSGLLKIHREDPCVAKGDLLGERVFTCPAHFCHACSVSGDAQRMVRCCRCPTAYHTRCVPPGVRRLTSKQIQCLSCKLLSDAPQTPTPQKPPRKRARKTAKAAKTAADEPP